ncbi:MAG: proton-conducting transporter membrane subunit [Armatimonadota bacterium]|nr:proton-conducting transporter membrane subunit [Armatimonadota bacterium]
MSEALVPAIVAVPVGSAAITWLVGRRRSRLSEAIAVAAAAATLAIAAGISWAVLGSTGVALVWAPSSFWALRIDALSAVVILVVAGLGLLVVAYAIPHMRALIEQGKTAQQRLALFYSLTLCFIGTMTWAAATDNIIVLFIAVEATTLASALLVAFYWNRRALEAGYKYLLLLTVGITFALFGCVLLYAAASGVPELGAYMQPMLMSHIFAHTGQIAAQAPSVLFLAMAFLIIGFGTKAGLIPFHPWLPDAHAEAPAPVSALLSGILIEVGAYALLRTTAPFYGAMPVVQEVLIVLGAVSMFVGIMLVAAEDDLKRLLAYSSVSQIGYVVMGMGIGGFLGMFGAIFHIINHAIAKSLLFFVAGAVEQATGKRRLSELSDLRRFMPVTAACFFVGALAIGGCPPLNGFVSKLTIFLAAAGQGRWWAAGVAVLTGLLTLIVLIRVGVRIFTSGMAAPRKSDEEAAPQAAAVAGNPHPREVALQMLAAMMVLVVLCVLLGVYPLVVSPAVERAAEATMAVGR